MSSPTEKNSDRKRCKRRRTQRLSDINSIWQPVPLLAPVRTHSSSTSTSDEFFGLTTGEEDIELAHNLILLSQDGNLIDQAAAKQSSGTPTSQSQPASTEMEKASAEIEIGRHDTIIPSRQSVQSMARRTSCDYTCNICKEKFNSPQALGRHRFRHTRMKLQSDEHKLQSLTDTATSQTTGRVYTCDICNKKFNSFQSLGGHRANHKKPKLESDEPKVQSSTAMGRTSSGIFLKLDDITNIERTIVRPPVVTTGNKARLHRCQKCSAVFHSGQALGGHMRKHNPLKPKTEKANDGRDGIVIQQQSISCQDSIVIQQQPNNDQDRITIQQQQLPNGDLVRIGLQQQPIGSLVMDLNLPAQPDQQDIFEQPPVAYVCDGSSPTTKLSLGMSD